MEPIDVRGDGRGERLETAPENDKPPLAIVALPHNHFDLWTLFSPFIEKAIARSGGLYTLEYILENVAADAMTLWLVFEPTGQPRGIVVTHMVEYPSGLRICEILLASGAHIGRRAAGLYDHLVYCARRAGAHRMLFIGRRGWLKLAPEFKEVGVIAERAL